MFGKASRLKLRFDSDVGLLTVEDLWDRSLPQLNLTAKKLNKDLAAAEEEDFLEEGNTEDAMIRLKFDIVLHILKTKKEEAEKRKEASERKMQKEKIMGIIEKKQDANLEEMSEKDLKKELSKLD